MRDDRQAHLQLAKTRSSRHPPTERLLYEAHAHCARRSHSPRAQARVRAPEAHGQRASGGPRPRGGKCFLRQLIKTIFFPMKSPYLPMLARNYFYPKHHGRRDCSHPELGRWLAAPGHALGLSAEQGHPRAVLGSGQRLRPRACPRACRWLPLSGSLQIAHPKGNSRSKGPGFKCGREVSVFSSRKWEWGVKAMWIGGGAWSRCFPTGSSLLRRASHVTARGGANYTASH